MLSIHEVETFLQRTPAELQNIVMELRDIIASAAPEAAEAVRWGRFKSCNDAPWGVKQLIEGSSRFDPRALRTRSLIPHAVITDLSGGTARDNRPRSSF